MKQLDKTLLDTASNIHESVNHKYDSFKYGYHLKKVTDNVDKFKNLIPEIDYLTVWVAGAWHDTIEDCRLTPNDVKEQTNEDVMLLVYALTNEKGLTRKDRANQKYYDGLIATKNGYGVFLKLCDRIANVEYSKTKESKMFKVYKNENDHFIKCLFGDDGFGNPDKQNENYLRYWIMVEYLNKIFNK